jgi:ABC-type nitrate/sulfonate/bicarbonate transport system permease component
VREPRRSLLSDVVLAFIAGVVVCVVLAVLMGVVHS